MSSAPPTPATPTTDPPPTAPTAPPDPAAPAPPDSLDALQLRVVELEAHLAAARQSLTQSERRREVYRQLVDSGATDAEAASALVMERITSASGGAEPDIPDEIRTLKRRKPALFKPTSSPSSMGGRNIDPPTTPVESAASDARTGGRAALLRYMRARRA